jgi:hypothetical protein
MNVVLCPSNPEETILCIHILADVVAIIFWIRGDLMFGLQPEECMGLLHVLADVVAVILWLQHRQGWKIAIGIKGSVTNFL